VAAAASVETPWVIRPRLAGLLKADTHAHAWFGLSTGLRWPVIALVEISEYKKRYGVGTAPALFTSTKRFFAPKRLTMARYGPERA
jgi:hypothetical protein